MIEGDFFIELTRKRKDSKELGDCIKETISKLLASETSERKPGMLLGKIQGGKTRAFIGIMALAFDNDYDMAIVLTKGTKALAEQTRNRIADDLADFIAEDKIQVYDIMHLPKILSDYELEQKIIIVAKKETNNLKRIIEAFGNKYTIPQKKKLLIIDDEADFASISFKKNKEEGTVELGKIAAQIDKLRQKVSASDFLQVTATPYSLYLQPDEDIANNESMLFKPIRPAFTALLPIYPNYIGGDYYFSDSRNESSTAFFVYREVPPEERNTLKKEDRRSFKIEQVLTSQNVRILRTAILNFMVGTCIRHIQQDAAGIRREKYSFIIHTEYSKASQSWQERIVNALREKLTKAIDDNPSELEKLIRESYKDLERSLKIMNGNLPSLEQVITGVRVVLKKGHLLVSKVNSETEAAELLDDKGQLKLRTPLNIFIGGQILDRGITIKNLIGFYYGRNPQCFQQDTVLQHSRMYGDRAQEDLAVTRFYTTLDIFNVMTQIHEFDSQLRLAFERGANDCGVYFIRKDVSNKLIPCSPNKILLSKITTLSPHKRLLPVGFQTDFKTRMKSNLARLDSLVDGAISQTVSLDEPKLISLAKAREIIDSIEETLIFEEGYEWDKNAFISSMEYLSQASEDSVQNGKVWVLVRRDRNLSRLKSDGGFSDDPDGGTGAPRETAKKIAIDVPVLILLRENGEESRGWRGSPFWWPVLMAPKNTKTTVFASESAEGN